MKKLLILLLFPFAAISQNKTTEVLPTDIYSERPAFGIPKMDGKVSGIKMECYSNPSTRPVAFKIRCATTPNVQNQPMIIVDGCELDYSLMSSINPNNIQSIDVIKSLSAIALYGTKAANGVILIKLKKSAAEILSSLPKLMLNKAGNIILDENPIKDYKESKKINSSTLTPAPTP